MPDTKFQRGVSGNPNGRPKNSSNKIPSKKKIDQSFISGSKDAINKLSSLLKSDDESTRYKAATKIVDEAYKLLKTGVSFNKGDVRNTFLEELESAIIELKTLMTTAESVSIQIGASSNILDKALIALKARDTEKASKKLNENKEKSVVRKLNISKL